MTFSILILWRVIVELRGHSWVVHITNIMPHTIGLVENMRGSLPEHSDNTTLAQDMLPALCVSERWNVAFRDIEGLAFCTAPHP